ncbi:MAG: hypothetical protein PHI96_04410 [Desulfovibrio sp.]|nr:hypothetical protein [Desulfovibrio sp.]
MKKLKVKLEDVHSLDAKTSGHSADTVVLVLASSCHYAPASTAKAPLSHRVYTLIYSAVLVCALIFSQNAFSKDAPQEGVGSVSALPAKAAGDAAFIANGGGENGLPPEQPVRLVEVRELWTGSLYSSTYKVGVCFSADGSVRGVVKLRLYNGQVDVYHIQGSVQNNEVRARHSSGHTFKGRLVSGDKVEGTIKLKNGMKVQLEGKRTHDVALAPENCAPLPE